MSCNACPKLLIHGIAYCPEVHVILRYCEQHYEHHRSTPQNCFRCGTALRWVHGDEADRVLRGFGPIKGMAASRVNSPVSSQGSSSQGSSSQGSSSQGSSSQGSSSHSPLLPTPVSLNSLKSDPPRPQVVSGVSAASTTSTTSATGPGFWMRCPYGCIFRVKPGKWRINSDNTGTCANCHRTGSLKGFSTVRNAQVLDLVERASANSLRGGNPSAVRAKILERMERLVGKWFWFFNRAERLQELYESVIHLLHSAELTSNFPTPRIYGLLATGMMQNFWYFYRPDGATSTERSYAAERDAGERKLFGPLFKGFELRTPVKPWRPVYVALNLGNLIQGAAPSYGQSYIVYKRSVMIRSTLTATDSLQMLKAARLGKGWKGLSEKDLATIVDIDKILLHVSDRQFEYLCGLAANQDVPNPNEFIEVQVWGEISLSKDVEAIVISESDLQGFVNLSSTHPDLLPAHYQQLSPQLRRTEIQRLKQMLRNFCAKAGIKLYFLPLNKDTMNSRTPRPSKPPPSDAGSASINPVNVRYSYTVPNWQYNPQRPDDVPNRVLQDARSGLYLRGHQIVINGHDFTVHQVDVEPTNDNWQGIGVYLRPFYRLRGG